MLSKNREKLGNVRRTTLRLSMDSLSIAAISTLSTASPQVLAMCSNDPEVKLGDVFMPSVYRCASLITMLHVSVVDILSKIPSLPISM